MMYFAPEMMNFESKMADFAARRCGVGLALGSQLESKQEPLVGRQGARHLEGGRRADDQVRETLPQVHVRRRRG